MTWGGSYSGMDHYGVTVVELTGSTDPWTPPIPEPMTVLATSMGFIALRRYLGRRQAC